MTIIRRPSPFGELLSLRQAMDRLFDDDFGPRAGWTTVTSGGGALPLDVTTTDDALIVEAALPGVDPDAVDINVADGTLTISARSESSASTKFMEGLPKNAATKRAPPRSRKRSSRMTTSLAAPHARTRATSCGTSARSSSS